MPAARATVLSLPNRNDPTSDAADNRTREGSPRPALGPIDEIFIVIGDRELEAFARLFAMSPLKRGMTFEAYLAVKGFARTIPPTPRRRARRQQPAAP